MRVTIRDIAEKAGVSKTAVSFAFNNPERISTQTRSRIRQIAEELGYVPDPVARTLARRRIGSIGLLLPQSVAEVFRNPYMAELLQGIGAVCQREGLTVSLIPPVKGMISLAIRSAMVDALILVGIGLDRGVGRLLGFRRALDAHGLRLGREGVYTHAAEGSVPAVAALARRILSAGRPPTAVVCMSDVAALGVYRACQELGIGIPASLSVAGLDDLALSPLLAPPLTTVHQSGFLKGKHAAALAVGLLNGRASPPVTLPFELRIRGSTAPAGE